MPNSRLKIVLQQMAKGITQLIDGWKRNISRNTFSQFQGILRLSKGG